MKKKWIAVVSMVIVLAMSVALLAACNPASVEQLSKSLEQNNYTVTQASTAELESMKDEVDLGGSKITFKGKVTALVTAIKDGQMGFFVYFADAKDSQDVYNSLKQSRDEGIKQVQEAYNKVNDAYKQKLADYNKMEDGIAKDAAKLALDAAKVGVDAAKSALDAIKDSTSIVKKGNAIGFGHKDAVKYL